MALILVLDESDLVRMIVREACERSNHTVIEESNNEQALRVAREFRPDIIILELFPQCGNSLDLIRKLKPWVKPAAFIGLAGLGREEGCSEVYDEAVSLTDGRIFPKPFDVTHVVGAVNEILVI